MHTRALCLTPFKISFPPFCPLQWRLFASDANSSNIPASFGTSFNQRHSCLFSFPERNRNFCLNVMCEIFVMLPVFIRAHCEGTPLPEGGVIRTALVVPCRLMSKLAALRPLISQRPAYSPWPGLAWLVFSVCLSCALDDISIRRLQADQRCDVRTGRKKTQRGDANCRLLLLASSDLSGAIEQGN